MIMGGKVSSQNYFKIPSLKLTVRTWTYTVGISEISIGNHHFKGRKCWISGRFRPNHQPKQLPRWRPVVLDEDRRCFSLHWPKVGREVPRGPPLWESMGKPYFLWVFIGYNFPQESLQNTINTWLHPNCPLSNPFIPLAPSNLVFIVTH